MADIPLYEDDSDGVLESDHIEDVGYDDYESDAGLSMLERLEKYCINENLYTRQMVTRSLLETIRTIENTDEAKTFLKAVSTLANDPESLIRSELMEHIPHIAIFCLESKHIFGDPIPDHLLPIVVRYITDQNNQVRKTSQAALLVLLEQDMIKRGEVERQVCPVIVDLAQPTSTDDFRTEAAALMCKLAPLIGKEATERLFLERFADMCTDGLFHVRKVCATNFGDMCQVVGRENTEKFLLNRFYYLCEDGVWGVRKACAECFMQVSCVCSPTIRHTDLVQVFSSLICDQSRWVRMAAFQALGGFISTFANPSHTGLYVSDSGNLVVGKPEDSVKENKREEVEHESSSPSSACDTNNLELRNDQSAITTPATANAPDSGVISEELSRTEAGLVSSALLPSMKLVQSDLKTGIEQLSLDDGAEVRATDGRDINEGSSSQDQPAQEVDDVLKPLCGDEPSHVSAPSDCMQSDSDMVISRSEPLPSQSSDDLHIPSNTKFNNFQYWRMPIPEIDIHLDEPEESEQLPVDDSNTVAAAEKGSYSCELPHSEQPAAKVDLGADPEGAVGEKDGDDGEVCGPIHTACVQTVCETVEEVANFGSTHVVGQHVSERTTALKGEVQDVSSHEPENVASVDDLLPANQDVIPPMLLEHYLSMVDPSRAQTVDSEIARHCAYSFPAVAYTLGRKYWPCLKDLYEKLAHDMQLKVRRTLAFSIHELAVILGEEITTRDLVPVFNCFLRDLDEVRIGVLKHLGDFLRLLKPEARQEYLTKVENFLETDNTRNWRFREELALQLGSLLDLYSTQDISEYLVPVAILLTEDPVAAVRGCAFHVLSAMIGCFNEAGDTKCLSSLINQIKERFALSTSSAKRQMYVYICHCVLEDGSLSQQQFAVDLLPPLVALSADSIPNVRIALSRTMARFIINSDYYTSAHNPVHMELLEAVQKLKSDSQCDVRYFLISTLKSTEIASDVIPV